MDSVPSPLRNAFYIILSDHKHCNLVNEIFTDDIKVHHINCAEIEKMKHLLMSMLIFGLIVAGCGGNNSSGEESNEDYIVITSVEPENVNEGEDTAFIVTFDYCLASERSGSVLIGFNDDIEEPNSYPVEDVMVLDEPVTGSVSIPITAIPVYHEPPDSYNVYINISPADHGSSWSPLANDIWTITVNQAASSLSINKVENSLYENAESVKCNHEECIDQND